MPLTLGTRIGAYEIVSKLGEGGMGEVYRARDTRLNREVALKVLPEAFAADAERIGRFRREAQVLASLNHPRIAAIYGLEESGAALFLVMELVEAGTLADKIGSGLPVSDALAIALEIADALEAAHEQGIVHRDLKPGNIGFTTDGQVKVLDFGLAKAFDPSPSQELSFSPTLSLAATQAGVILGTAAYMSPEQAKGRPVDKRTDVWAFGCVLYEMLAGTRAFDGEDLTDTIALVVRGEPDWNALPADVPAHIRAVLQQCLHKDRRQRIADVAVVRYVIAGGALAQPLVASQAALPPLAAPRSRARKAMLAAVSVAAALAIAAASAWGAMHLSRPETPFVTRFAITPAPPQGIAVQGADRDIAISPDGTHLVYRTVNNAAPILSVRALGDLNAVPLSGTESARYPFFSPDGRWVGFFSGNQLKKVSINGGSSVSVCMADGAPRGATWTENGQIIFATNNITTGLQSVPASGGEPKALTKPAQSPVQTDHVFPYALPDGHSVLYTIINTQQSDAAQIAVRDLKTGSEQLLVRGGSQAEYVRPGFLVYAAGGSLRAVHFDLNRLQVVGDPVPVVERVMASNSGAAEFSISNNGSLVTIPGNSESAALVTTPRTLVWVDRQGREQPIKAPVRTYGTARLAPDGSRIALAIYDQGNDIWIFDTSRQTLERLTSDASIDMSPVWTWDSRRIFWTGTSGGTPNIFSQAADGTGKPQRLTSGTVPQFPTALSPDGKSLILWEAPTANFSLTSLNVDDASGVHNTTTLLQSNAATANPDISSDGRWIAYQSNESGQTEVYVRPYPHVDEGRVLISTGGGTRPAWSRNGRELFYLDAGGFLTSTPIQVVENTLKAGAPAKVLNTRYFPGSTTRGPDLRGYDVSPDGQRFLMIKDAASGETTAQNGTGMTLVVTLNWLEELKAKVGR